MKLSKWVLLTAVFLIAAAGVSFAGGAKDGPKEMPDKIIIGSPAVDIIPPWRQGRDQRRVHAHRAESGSATRGAHRGVAPWQ